MSALIFIVAKVPMAGASKTRLIPLLEAEGAASLSRCMVLDTVSSMLGPVRGSEEKEVANTDVCVYFAPEEAVEQMRELVAPADAEGRLRLLGIPSAVQGGTGRGSSNLTDVLTHALREGQRGGADGLYSSITFVGSDCPHLSRSELARGVREAAAGRAYLAPACDGGYVLLSLPATCPPTVFQDVRWSATDTLASQQAALEASGLAVSVGTRAYRDVDEPDDALALLHQAHLCSDEGTCTHSLSFLKAHPACT